jgi:hypothetical protein
MSNEGREALYELVWIVRDYQFLSKRPPANQIAVLFNFAGIEIQAWKWSLDHILSNR